MQFATVSSIGLQRNRKISLLSKILVHFEWPAPLSIFVDPLDWFASLAQEYLLVKFSTFLVALDAFLLLLEIFFYEIP